MKGGKWQVLGVQGWTEVLMVVAGVKRINGDDARQRKMLR